MLAGKKIAVLFVWYSEFVLGGGELLTFADFWGGVMGGSGYNLFQGGGGGNNIISRSLGLEKKSAIYLVCME